MGCVGQRDIEAGVLSLSTFLLKVNETQIYTTKSVFVHNPYSLYELYICV